MPDTATGLERGELAFVLRGTEWRMADRKDLLSEEEVVFADDIPGIRAELNKRYPSPKGTSYLQYRKCYYNDTLSYFQVKQDLVVDRDISLDDLRDITREHGPLHFPNYSAPACINTMMPTYNKLAIIDDDLVGEGHTLYFDPDRVARTRKRRNTCKIRDARIDSVNRVLREFNNLTHYFQDFLRSFINQTLQTRVVQQISTFRAVPSDPRIADLRQGNSFHSSKYHTQYRYNERHHVNIAVFTDINVTFGATRGTSTTPRPMREFAQAILVGKSLFRGKKSKFFWRKSKQYKRLAVFLHNHPHFLKIQTLEGLIDYYKQATKKRAVKQYDVPCDMTTILIARWVWGDIQRGIRDKYLPKKFLKKAEAEMS